GRGPDPPRRGVPAGGPGPPRRPGARGHPPRPRRPRAHRGRVMSNPFTFLLPLNYDTVRNVLLVQSGPADLAVAFAARLRALFPGAQIAGVLFESAATT